jgi:hypothetical protein
MPARRRKRCFRRTGVNTWNSAKSCHAVDRIAFRKSRVLVTKIWVPSRTALNPNK